MPVLQINHVSRAKFKALSVKVTKTTPRTDSKAVFTFHFRCQSHHSVLAHNLCQCHLYRQSPQLVRRLQYSLISHSYDDLQKGCLALQAQETNQVRNVHLHSSIHTAVIQILIWLCGYRITPDNAHVMCTPCLIPQSLSARW
jgi:hypothetical protein